MGDIKIKSSNLNNTTHNVKSAFIAKICKMKSKVCGVIISTRYSICFYIQVEDLVVNTLAALLLYYTRLTLLNPNKRFNIPQNTLSKTK